MAGLIKHSWQNRYRCLFIIAPFIKDITCLPIFERQGMTMRPLAVLVEDNRIVTANLLYMFLLVDLLISSSRSVGTCKKYITMNKREDKRASNLTDAQKGKKRNLCDATISSNRYSIHKGSNDVMNEAIWRMKKWHIVDISRGTFQIGTTRNWELGRTLSVVHHFWRAKTAAKIGHSEGQPALLLGVECRKNCTQFFT